MSSTSTSSNNQLTIELAIKSQLNRKRKRSSSAKNPEAKKSKTGKPKKSRLDQLKPTTPDDIAAIQRFLCVCLMYNASKKNHFLMCGLTVKPSHYFMFPIITEKPPSKHELPGDNYFLGCDEVAYIEYALREVYYARYGGDPATRDHERWAIYKYNQMYYGAKQFQSRLSNSVTSDMLSKHRSYGGSVIPPYTNIAECISHKTVKPWIVEIKGYFDSHPDRIPPQPAGAPALNFLPLEDLLTINRLMKEQKDSSLLELDEADVKRIKDVVSDDDDGEPVTDSSEESD